LKARSYFPFLLILATASISLDAVADTTLPKPYMSDSGLLIFATSPGADLVNSLPVPTYLFQSAVNSCAISEKEVGDAISGILAQDGIVFNSLKQMFTDPAKLLSSLNLSIVVEDFGDMRNTYASFYLSPQQGYSSPYILLDCSQNSRGYWTASLAHELTHALLASQRLDSWFEEGIAQMIEVQAGGYEPKLAVQLLSQQNEIPPLFDLRRPLVGHPIYAHTYLFAKYVASQFGGWETLRAMVGLGDPGNCAINLPGLERATCYGQNSLISRAMNEIAEKMTPGGIFRFFAVAETLNLSSFPLYSIADWTGFSNAPGSLPAMLGPGQIARVNPTNVINLPINPQLEAYSVRSDGIENFNITSANSAADVIDSTGYSINYYLIINPTSQTLPTTTH